VLKLLRLFNLRHLRRRRLATALCLLGIAIGVAVMVAIDLANENAMLSFRRTVDAVTGQTTHQLTGVAGGIPDSLAAAIISTPNLSAAPVIEYVVACREANKDALHLLGVDPFKDAAFRDYTGFAAPQDSALRILDATLLDFLTKPGAALVSAPFLQKHGLAAHDTLHVLVGSDWREIFIAGTITDELLARMGFDNLALMDISTAQEVLSRVGHIDRIDLRADADQIAVLQTKLPAALKITTPAGRTRRVEDMLRSFRLNLTALSFLAVLVGMFLIYNTMMFAVIHRRKQIGILRCLGVTPRQIVGNALSEAFGLGVIGASLGIALGIFLAQYTTAAVSSTISQLYVFLKVEGVQLEWPILLRTFGLGILTTFVASALPAYEAATVSPAVAVRRSALESRAGKFAPWLTVFGMLLLFLAFVLYLYSESFWGGLGVALGVSLAAICFTPWLTLLLARALSPVSRRLAAQPGLLATRSIRAALSRTAVAIAALMLALAMVLGMRLMITSFRATVTAWVNTFLEGDIYLSSSGFATARWEATMSPDFIRYLRDQPEVEAINPYGVTPFVYRGKAIYLVAINAEVIKDRLPFLFAGGRPGENWQGMLNGGVFVSEMFARRFQKSAGDTLHLQTQEGTAVFEVAAVFVDYSFDLGQVMMDHRVFAQRWGPSRVNSLSVFLKPGVNTAEYAAALRRAAVGKFAVQVASNRELRDAILNTFDQTFRITYVMQLLAGLVAFIGIISAVMSLLIERTRELGILRAVGMSLRQLRSMIFLESGLMGTFAGLIALPAGTVLAVVLVYVINLRTFDWTINLRFDFFAYVDTFVLAILTSLLAAVYPLWRVNSIPIAGALREE
jgi:putative ABC transport system permease protein